MAGGYERVRSLIADGLPGAGRFGILTLLQVHAQDDDDVSPVERRSDYASPNSPPPSFRSRASSPNRNQQVDATLAGAFDDSDDSSDDEGDDRQRLVRRNSGPSAGNSLGSSQELHTPPSSIPSQPVATSATPASRQQRVVGGGNGSDGVFANMSARPERVESEKDEMPPVSR